MALGAIHQKILDLLKSHGEGLTIYEIRKLIPDMDVQQHLDRRVRDLRDYYNIPRERRGKDWVYVYRGERKTRVIESGINENVRAQVLGKAKSRCQMCGATIAEHGVKLQVDHKIPRNWGGTNDIDNLWAICEACNRGKRDFFASFNEDEMRSIMSKESVYERIAETLRLHLGQPTPAWLLEFVANANDYQEDWQKRLRELRYPPIGLKIAFQRRKLDSGKVEIDYVLEEWKALPPNHKTLIKAHERLKKALRSPQSGDGE